MGRKKTACKTCAVIKTVCSKESPCARCKRLALPCSLGSDPHDAAKDVLNGQSWGRQAPEHASDRDSRTTHPSTSQQLSRSARKSRFRATHSRSSGGCDHCRNRRKKCDETRPICGDCSRLGMPCGFRTSSSLPSPQALSTPPESNADSLSPLVNVNSIGEATHPSSPFYEEPPHSLFDWITVIEENYSSESAKTNLANSSALKVLPHERASDEDASFASLPATALGNLTGITPEALSGWTIGERHLLNHFLQSVSRSLVVVSDEYNPFLRVIVPMALENSVVRNALAALSACHLSKVYPDFSRNLLVHRTKALEGMKAEIDEQETVVWALAATLLLCLLEICEGDSRKWLLYLHGAQALLSNINFEVDGTPFNFLVELYNYLCCIGSVTSPNIPQLSVKGMDLWKVSSKQQNGQSIHPLVGISGELYQLLPRINRLAVQRVAAHQNEVTEQAVQFEAKAIELLLQSWSPPENGTYADAELRAAAFAIQWAAILRLRHAMRGSADDDARTVGLTENIISALSLIRPGSEMESHLLFPLFMAGVGSVTKANRLTLEYRINIMESTIGFGNISSAHKIMENIWRRKHYGERVDWEVVMQAENPGLLLF